MPLSRSILQFLHELCTDVQMVKVFRENLGDASQEPLLVKLPGGLSGE